MENQAIKKPITTVAIETTNAVNKAIKNSPTGVSFVRVTDYINKQGEKSNITINVGVSYENQLKKDIAYLENLDLSSIVINNEKVKDDEVEELKVRALAELLTAAKKSLVKTIAKKNGTLTDEQKNERLDPYIRFSDAPQIKVHEQSGEIFIEGYKVKKTVLESVVYAEKNSKPLTIVKDVIRKGMKINNFRQYTFESINTLALSGTTIEFLEQVI